jgi:type I restriction enzyme S subunit
LSSTGQGNCRQPWHVETIDNLCDVITNGGTPSRSNDAFWAGGTMPWFKTGDFADGFLLAPVERISEAAIAGSSVKVLPANAILMAIYAAPTVGRLGILTENATFNQACTGMVAKGSIGPWFLLLTLFFGRVWFNSRANGAAQQNISKAIVASYQAVVPSEPLLDRFHEIADGIYSRIRANSMQAQTLATLRDTLLPRLISGQIRLADVVEADAAFA